jgi:hypothetical protein
MGQVAVGGGGVVALPLTLVGVGHADLATQAVELMVVTLPKTAEAWVSRSSGLE